MTDLKVQGEVPLLGGRKAVQLVSLVIPGPPVWVQDDGPEGSDEPPTQHLAPGPASAYLFALCDDGTVWAQQVNARGADGRPLPWAKVPGPPTHDTAQFAGDPRGGLVR